jgi:hypothetical protein
MNSIEQVLEYVKQLAQAHIQINNFHTGEIWTVNADTDRIGVMPAYPSLSIDPVRSEISVDPANGMYMQYTFRISVFDLVVSEQASETQEPFQISPEMLVLSDTQQILADIIRQFIGITGSKNMEIEPIINMTKFAEKWSDGVAGWEAEIAINTPFVGACIVPNR